MFEKLLPVGLPLLGTPVRVYRPSADTADYNAVRYSLDDTLHACGLEAPGGTLCIELREPVADGSVTVCIVAPGATGGPLRSLADALAPSALRLPRESLSVIASDAELAHSQRCAPALLLSSSSPPAGYVSTFEVAVSDTVDSLKIRIAEREGAWWHLLRRHCPNFCSCCWWKHNFKHPATAARAGIVIERISLGLQDLEDGSRTLSSYTVGRGCHLTVSGKSIDPTRSCEVHIKMLTGATPRPGGVAATGAAPSSGPSDLRFLLTTCIAVILLLPPPPRKDNHGHVCPGAHGRGTQVTHPE